MHNARMATQAPVWQPAHPYSAANFPGALLSPGCVLCSAATLMNEQMTRHILHAPLAFFHTNPSGRILNRFSKDQGVVDDFLPQVLFDAIQSIFMVLGGPLLRATDIRSACLVQWICRMFNSLPFRA